jgi:hypothetical protein
MKNVKNKLFLATAIIALAACSDNTYMGEPVDGAGTGAISFNMNTPSLSRAQDHATSAATLNNQFIVWGEKSASAESGSAGTPVFINYVVNYGANSAQTSESNSSDWEYVGQTPYANTKVVASAAPTHVTEQTIKYWDLTNNKYTFTAISALPADISGDKVTVTKNVSGSTVYDKGYTVAVKEGASADKIYFADRTLVEAGESTKSIPVTLNFRSLMSQVRFGFYETIPGYSVKITDVKYSSTSHTTNAAGNFGVDCSGAVLVPGASTSFTVTYDDGSVVAANQNKAKVAVTASNTQNYLSTTAASFFGTTLGTSSDARTWENGGNYTKILPNPSNTTDLTLTISYRLTSTDGSGETIDITDATAKVPAAYAKWQSNYAYTYLFKITDNYGLYPITFDAVVVEDEAGNQETITTVETPSITTYAKGVNPTVAAKAEYPTSSNIYVTVDKSGTVQTLTVGTNANLYLVTNTTGSGATQEITEASVANALANGTPTDTNTDSTNDTWTVTGVGMKDLKVTTIGVPTLTATTKIDKADSPTGVDITVNGAMFTPTSAGTYVFEFIDTADSNKKYYKIIKVVAAS